jgi:hypothetical protein
VEALTAGDKERVAEAEGEGDRVTEAHREAEALPLSLEEGERAFVVGTALLLPEPARAEGEGSVLGLARELLGELVVLRLAEAEEEMEGEPE